MLQSDLDNDTVDDLVLVVDDDHTLRMVVCESLKQVKYRVIQAEDVAVAKTIIKETEGISLVITDVVMPGESGVDLLRWSKTECPEIPFIIMTGHAEVKFVAEALNLGAQHFLQKPFRPLMLIEAVNGILSTLHLKRQNEQLRKELSNYNVRLRQEVVEARIENQKLFMATLTSLSNAIDARDAYTCEHSSSVAELSGALAGHLGKDLTFQDFSFTAGQLHDIGKIAVPEGVLLKPSRLTDEEFDLIKEHPERGEKILYPLPDFDDIRPGVRNHHERFDGKGYPDGLSGYEIPELARIISVCDCWNAMRTDRPYRKAMPVEKACSVLKEEAGKQFDPEISNAFLDMIMQKESE